MDIETLHIGRFFETMEDVDAYEQQLRQVFFYPLVYGFVKIQGIC